MIGSWRGLAVAAAIGLSVAGIPLAWLVIGGAVVWWRRRAAR
jgi:hypothetical protein